MSGPWATAVAVSFVWLGMVLAISFLEAPIKFRVPEVTVPVGLSIGRRVFRALNIVESVLAAVLLAALLLAAPPAAALVAGAVAIAALLVQLIGVRPRLNRRTRDILAGGTRSRSREHHAYVVLESLKTIALLLGGVLLLSL